MLIEQIKQDLVNHIKSGDKTKISITKPVGYLSAGEYIERKIARRVPDLNKPFELPQAPAGNGTLTC